MQNIRPDSVWQKLFEEAGLHCVKQAWEPRFRKFLLESRGSKPFICCYPIKSNCMQIMWIIWATVEVTIETKSFLLSEISSVLVLMLSFLVH